MVGSSDDEKYFPYKLLLTNRQVVNLCKAFAKKLSTEIKLSKDKLSKMISKKLSLIENLIKPLANSVLIPLGLTVATSAADAVIYEKILGSETKH